MNQTYTYYFDSANLFSHGLFSIVLVMKVYYSMVCFVFYDFLFHIIFTCYRCENPLYHGIVRNVLWESSDSQLFISMFGLFKWIIFDFSN